MGVASILYDEEEDHEFFKKIKATRGNPLIKGVVIGSNFSNRDVIRTFGTFKRCNFNSSERVVKQFEEAIPHNIHSDETVEDLLFEYYYDEEDRSIQSNEEILDIIDIMLSTKDHSDLIENDIVQNEDEYDFFIPLKPIKEYDIEIEITSIKKGKLNIEIDDLDL